MLPAAVALSLSFSIDGRLAHRGQHAVRPSPRFAVVADASNEVPAKKAQLDRDFAKIAAPAFIQFAAEPLA